MNQEIRNKSAEILYISGYAVACEFSDMYPIITRAGKKTRVDPFANSLEGKRQACAIIEWLRFYKNRLWSQSANEPGISGHTTWQHVLNRLAWCLYILGKNAR
jgi:hypothetical protein